MILFVETAQYQYIFDVIISENIDPRPGTGTHSMYGDHCHINVHR